MLLNTNAKSIRQLHGATQVCIRRVEEHRIQLGRVTTRMGSLEVRLDIIQPIVNQTRRRAQECEMSVAPMGSQLQDVDRRVNVLGTQVTTIGQQVQEVTQRVTTMASQMVGVDNIKNQIAHSHMGNARPQVSLLGEQVGETLSKLQTLELRTTVCSGHMTTLLTDYGEMRTQIGTMGSQMAGLSQNVASIDTIKYDMDVITKNVGALQGPVGHIRQTVDQSIKRQLQHTQQQASKVAIQIADSGPIPRKMYWLEQQLLAQRGALTAQAATVERLEPSMTAVGTHQQKNMDWVKQQLANRQQQAQAQQQTVAALQQRVESSEVLHRKVAQLEATVASLTRQVMTVSPPGPPQPPNSGLPTPGTLPSDEELLRSRLLASGWRRLVQAEMQTLLGQEAKEHTQLQLTCQKGHVVLATHYTWLSVGKERLWRAYVAHSLESKLCQQAENIEQLRKNLSLHLSGHTEGMGMESW